MVGGDIMKREFKLLTWKTKRYDCNSNKIYDYDILKYREPQIKEFKKKCATKEEFAEKMRREMMWSYWSKAEHELIIEIDENNRIWLKPWVGCRNPEDVRIDVTDDESFDWRGFAETHIGKQICKNEAKIDIFDQLTFSNQFEKFIDYLWHNRLKYERDNPKFH
jgi:hypothetical protein